MPSASRLTIEAWDRRREVCSQKACFMGLKKAFTIETVIHYESLHGYISP